MIKFPSNPGEVFKKWRTEFGVGLATASFLASFFLPAFGTTGDSFSGFECAKCCFLVASEWKRESLYFGGFDVFNLAFPVIAWAVLFRPRHRLLIRGAAIVSVAYVASWQVLYVVSSFRNAAPEESWLLVGYYVWLASFALLAVSAMTTREPGS
ncbi:MAG: hypothetical protein IPN71_11330 [Fibrobacteres bacterium]|nr:hypothetical protein [Fibrobacterota bacterium]